MIFEVCPMLKLNSAFIDRGPPLEDLIDRVFFLKAECFIRDRVLQHPHFIFSPVVCFRYLNIDFQEVLLVVLTPKRSRRLQS